WEPAYPSVTSSEFDYERMGTKAAEKLLHAIKGEPEERPTSMVFKLKRRASTAIN
ncbi:substrate-binding domain-containing protein, partial [Vibrio sp. S457-15]|uniref:substrate-binding domain-containing protein n=1 Tax=Vibrio sp. S457-15 TaxID=1620393 RepID=UPI000A8641A3